jgi:hypothetical protein
VLNFTHTPASDSYVSTAAVFIITTEWMRDGCREQGSAVQMTVYQSLQLAVQCLDALPQHSAAAQLHTTLAAACTGAHPRFRLPAPAPGEPLRGVAAWCVDAAVHAHSTGEKSHPPIDNERWMEISPPEYDWRDGTTRNVMRETITRSCPHGLKRT